MTDFVLPTQDTFDAVDSSGYTITDSDAGFLTKEVGSAIKILADQMPNSEMIHVRSPRTATGKTEKFIIDNIADADAMPKIVTSDFFGDTLLDCTNFFTYTGNHAKIYKNIFQAPVVTNDGDGNPTQLVIGSVNDGDVTLDLTQDPPSRSSSQLASMNDLDEQFNMSTMVNQGGTALGTASDDFKPELVVAMLNPVTSPKTAWDQYAAVTLIASCFNNLPDNGVMLVNHIEYSGLNQALWAVLNAQTSVGRTYNISWIASEGADQIVDVAVIKRLS
ncbi:hypothetical protein OAQ62_01295 [bacterium]|nr:hypothetical protein [bacterium]